MRSTITARGQLKNWTLIRPIITSDGSLLPGVGLNTDYGTGAFVSLPTAVASTGATWDVSLWDVALWPWEGLTSADWQTISGTGQCCSVITSVQTLANGAANGVLLQLNGWDMAFEAGGLMSLCLEETREVSAWAALKLNSNFPLASPLELVWLRMVIGWSGHSP